jgi:predicted transcriptional regulator
MDVLWNFGASNVRDVVGQMQRELAYTTVMTTLDRLYKKGLLGREMTERAFVYAPKLTREEWNRRRAGEMMAGFLSGPEESRHLLLSCLVDAVGSHDLQLLDELENKIQRKREELANSKQK